MQEKNTRSGSHHVMFGRGGWTALALTIALAACQAPATDAAGTADTAAAPTAAAPVETPAATPHDAPATTTADAAAAAPTSSVTADDDVPPVLDDSYNKATLRPGYASCIKASDAVTFDMQACGDEELAFHEQKLEQEFSKILALPDGQEKDKLMDAQAAYMHDTNLHCTYDPDEDGQGQMLDKQSCRINRTANRVEQLKALNLK